MHKEGNEIRVAAFPFLFFEFYVFSSGRFQIIEFLLCSSIKLEMMFITLVLVARLFVTYHTNYACVFVHLVCDLNKILPGMNGICICNVNSVTPQAVIELFLEEKHFGSDREKIYVFCSRIYETLMSTLVT
jgi:hypothetical protein